MLLGQPRSAILPRWPFSIDPASPQAQGLSAIYTASDLTSPSERNLGGRGYIKRWSSGVTVVFDTEMGWVWNFDNSTKAAIDISAVYCDYITISAWIKTTASGPDGIVGADNTSSTRMFQFRLNSGKLDFIVFKSGGGFATATSADSINTGAWVHVAGTYDGSNIQCYVNGSANGAAAALAGTLNQANMWWAIGDLAGNPSAENHAYPFQGQMAEVRIYNRALGASEVADLYYAPTRWSVYQVQEIPFLQSVDAPPVSASSSSYAFIV